MEKTSSLDDRFWETNAKWNPTLVPYGPGKPRLMQVLGGTPFLKPWHEDFRSDGSVCRFRVVMPWSGRTGHELSAYIHSLFEIEMYAWWWIEIDETTVAVSFRLHEIKN